MPSGSYDEWRKRERMHPEPIFVKYLFPKQKSLIQKCLIKHPAKLEVDEQKELN